MWEVLRNLNSEAVTQMAYNTGSNVLLVDFRRDGSRYAFLDVAPRLWTIFTAVAGIAGVSLGFVLNAALIQRQLGFRVG